jgi:hypothetical protein
MHFSRRADRSLRTRDSRRLAAPARRTNSTNSAAKVRSAFEDQQLPEGLPEGSAVKIVGFDTGHFDVEHQGRKFKISMTCVENLHQLWN